MLRSSLLPALAAASALAALPAAAHAGAITQATYDVSYSGVYRFDADEGDPAVYGATRRQELSFGSIARGLVVEVGHESAETAVATTSDVSSTLSGEYHQQNYDPPVTQDCTTAQVGPAQPGLVGARTDRDGTTSIDFEPFQRVDGRQTCTQGVLDDSLAVLGAPLAAKVTIPREQAGAERIRLPVDLSDGAPCPSFDLTLRCQSSMVGEVVLTRTAVQRAPDPAPPAPPAPAPVPTPVPGTTTDDDDLLYPLVRDEDLLAPLVPRQTARVDRSRRTLAFRAACREVCTGTLMLRGTPRRRASVRASGASAPVIARIALRVQRPHRLAPVEVRLPLAASRALRRVAKATASIELTETLTGKRTTTQLPVRLPRR